MGLRTPSTCRVALAVVALAASLLSVDAGYLSLSVGSPQYKQTGSVLTFTVFFSETANAGSQLHIEPDFPGSSVLSQDIDVSGLTSQLVSIQFDSVASISYEIRVRNDVTQFDATYLAVQTYAPECVGSVLHNSDEIASLAGCTFVFGTVTIAPSVLSVGPIFNDLVTIHGDFIVQNNNHITSLEVPLWTVGDITVRNNSLLTHVSFPDLQTSGAFLIAYVPVTDLPGFGSFLSASGEFAIRFCSNLAHISGFSQLISTVGFDIEGNPNLVDMNGFSQLQSVQQGPLVVAHCPVLTSIEFPQLYTTEDISFTNLPSLTTIVMSTLFSVGGSVFFISLPSITSFDLHNLGAVAGDLTFLGWSSYCRGALDYPRFARLTAGTAQFHLSDMTTSCPTLIPFLVTTSPNNFGVLGSEDTYIVIEFTTDINPGSGAIVLSADEGNVFVIDASDGRVEISDNYASIYVAGSLQFGKAYYLSVGTAAFVSSLGGQSPDFAISFSTPPCDPACASCTGISSEDCIDCASGYRRVGNGAECYQVCDAIEIVDEDMDAQGCRVFEAVTIADTDLAYLPEGVAQFLAAGTLTIRNNDNLVDLSPLGYLTELFDGGFVFENNGALDTLDLPFTLVVGTFSVTGNGGLVTINQFSGLSELDDVVISNNPNLETISAFNGVHTLKSLQIADNPSLTTLSAFEAVGSITKGPLSILRSSDLESISPMYVTRIGTEDDPAPVSVDVEGTGIATLLFLDYLETVSGDFRLQDLGNLASVSLLYKVDVGGTLAISNCPLVCRYAFNFAAIASKAASTEIDYDSLKNDCPRTPFLVSTEPVDGETNVPININSVRFKYSTKIKIPENFEDPILIIGPGENTVDEVPPGRYRISESGDTLIVGMQKGILAASTSYYVAVGESNIVSIDEYGNVQAASITIVFTTGTAIVPIPANNVAALVLTSPSFPLDTTVGLYLDASPSPNGNATMSVSPVGSQVSVDDSPVVFTEDNYDYTANVAVVVADGSSAGAVSFVSVTGDPVYPLTIPIIALAENEALPRPFFLDTGSASVSPIVSSLSGQKTFFVAKIPGGLGIVVYNSNYGIAQLVSVADDPGDSWGPLSVPVTVSAPCVSADGRYVAFESDAVTVRDSGVENTARVSLVYIVDLVADITVMACRLPNGTVPTTYGCHLYPGAMSADGTLLVMSSQEPLVNYVDLSAGVSQVFVYDVQDASIDIVTVGDGPGDLASDMAAISADGTTVVFRTLATNLIVRDEPDLVAVMVYNMDEEAFAELPYEHTFNRFTSDVFDLSINSNGNVVAYVVSLEVSPSYGKMSCLGFNREDETVFAITNLDFGTAECSRVSTTPDGKMFGVTLTLNGASSAALAFNNPEIDSNDYFKADFEVLGSSTFESPPYVTVTPNQDYVLFHSASPVGSDVPSWDEYAREDAVYLLLGQSANMGTLSQSVDICHYLDYQADDVCTPEIDNIIIAQEVSSGGYVTIGEALSVTVSVKLPKSATTVTVSLSMPPIANNPVFVSSDAIITNADERISLMSFDKTTGGTTSITLTLTVYNSLLDGEDSEDSLMNIKFYARVVDHESITDGQTLTLTVTAASGQYSTSVPMALIVVEPAIDLLLSELPPVLAVGTATPLVATMTFGPYPEDAPVLPIYYMRLRVYHSDGTDLDFEGATLDVDPTATDLFIDLLTDTSIDNDVVSNFSLEALATREGNVSVRAVLTYSNLADGGRRYRLVRSANSKVVTSSAYGRVMVDAARRTIMAHPSGYIVACTWFGLSTDGCFRMNKDGSNVRRLGNDAIAIHGVTTDGTLVAVSRGAQAYIASLDNGATWVTIDYDELQYWGELWLGRPVADTVNDDPDGHVLLTYFDDSQFAVTSSNIYYRDDAESSWQIISSWDCGC